MTESLRPSLSERTSRNCPVRTDLPPEITAVRYSKELRALWDNFVFQAHSSTFLFSRDYMDYHSDRFTDHSLLLFEDGRVVGALPSNQVDCKIISHAGLTYGGLVLDKGTPLTRTIRIFHALLTYYRQAGFSELIYKKLPLYHLNPPVALDEYPLFLAGGELIRREPSFVVIPAAGTRLRPRLRRYLRAAQRFGLTIEESGEYRAFWQEILEPNLRARHGVRPVHSPEEIVLLHRRFPENIRLYLCKERGLPVGGAVVYLAGKTAHVQYSSANQRGFKLRSQYFLFDRLISIEFADFDYFSFGISNEPPLGDLNPGLVEWKENLNALPFSHDTYRIDLTKSFRGLERNMQN